MTWMNVADRDRWIAREAARRSRRRQIAMLCLTIAALTAAFIMGMSL